MDGMLLKAFTVAHTGRFLLLMRVCREQSYLKLVIAAQCQNCDSRHTKATWQIHSGTEDFRPYVCWILCWEFSVQVHGGLIQIRAMAHGEKGASVFPAPFLDLKWPWEAISYTGFPNGANSKSWGLFQARENAEEWGVDNFFLLLQSIRNGIPSVERPLLLLLHMSTMLLLHKSPWLECLKSLLQPATGEKPGK